MKIPEPPGNLESLEEEVRAVRERFDRLVEAHRPALWRYCLRLTGSAWDAEDLVQETLSRAFARLARFWQPIETRGYLFRIASNAWIDGWRRDGRGALDFVEEVPDAGMAPPAPEAGWDAMRVVVTHLPPRARVAFLLIEGFDFTAADVAAVLGTTVGAVKAMLHRARTTLRRATDAESRPRQAPEPDAAVVARYVEAFSRRDPDAIAALLAPGAEVEIVGAGDEWGVEIVRRASLSEWATDPREQWAEFGTYEGRPTVFVFYRGAEGGRALGWLSTLETAEGAIVRQRCYYFTPELIEAVAASLGVPAQTRGHRYVPTPS